MPVRTIDEYIATFDSEVGAKLKDIRELVKEVAPDALETINYGIPTFRMNGKNLVHFAGYRKHIGFYPTPSGIEAFKEELAVYELSKGTVKFSLEQLIPFDLIRRIVQFRVRELK